MLRKVCRHAGCREGGAGRRLAAGVLAVDVDDPAAGADADAHRRRRAEAVRARRELEGRAVPAPASAERAQVAAGLLDERRHFRVPRGTLDAEGVAAILPTTLVKTGVRPIELLVVKSLREIRSNPPSW